MSTLLHCRRCRRYVEIHEPPERAEPCPSCGESLRPGRGRRTRPAVAWSDEPLSNAETLRRQLDRRRP